MAYIDDLVATVTDPTLRKALVAEVARMRERSVFGLVFERHIPETGALPRLAPRKGSLVLRRGDEHLRYVVESVDGEDASIRDVTTGEERTVAARDLLVTASLGQPIFPTLTSLGRMERGADRPFHSVVNAENYHALQLFSYLYARQVDCIYTGHVCE